MDLNKLSKDILIKLICTIEKDTREKIFAEKWNISRELHYCSCCYGVYHANHNWHCVVYKEKHREGLRNNCYMTFSEERKRRYVKCKHYKEKLIR